MPLAVSKVRYINFRNQHDMTLEPSRGLTILVGHNAVGKTNCIEGIYLLMNGTTFRRLENSSNLIMENEELATVEATLTSEKRVVDVSCQVEWGKKRYMVNGKKCRPSESSKLLPPVLFNPDDLLIIKGSASGRRDLLDDIGTQLSETYGQVLRDYTRALTQRNALLREEILQRDVFEAWTASLVASGAALTVYREALVRRISPYVAQAYGTLAADEDVQITYQPGVEMEIGEGRLDRQVVAGAFYRELETRSAEELHRKTTVAGPHRDDILFQVEGRPVRLFGSQGQQRSVILAVKIAHAHLVREMIGHYPIFLLDDVMSELDTQRRSALMTLIDNGMQTIVTTTNLGYFTEEERAEAKVVNISHDLD